tara:strand:- start:419 stop:745 length:327 start_codon:yes stop_codon:yes gene_type:complete
MAAPIVGALLAAASKAAQVIAKNKKTREALTKSVGGSLKRRQKLATTTGKFPKPSSGKGLSTGAKVALGFGAGAVAGKELERHKRIKQQKKTGKAYNITGRPSVYEDK